MNYNLYLASSFIGNKYIDKINLYPVIEFLNNKTSNLNLELPCDKSFVKENKLHFRIKKYIYFLYLHRMGLSDISISSKHKQEILNLKERQSYDILFHLDIDTSLFLEFHKENNYFKKYSKSSFFLETLFLKKLGNNTDTEWTYNIFSSFLDENILKSVVEPVIGEYINDLETNKNTQSIIVELKKDIKSNISKDRNKSCIPIILDKDKTLNFIKEKHYFYINCTANELKELNPDRTLESLKSEHQSFYNLINILGPFIVSRKQNFNLNYTISNTGRHFSFLTGLTKRIRNPLLKANGYIEYDIENSAPNFLYHFHKNISTTKTPNLLYYLKNKKEVRERITQEIYNKSNDDLIKNTKQILTSLFFGAKSQENNYYSAINEILGEPKNKAYKNFYSSFYISNLVQEIQALMETVATYIKTNYYNPESNSISCNGIE